MQRVTPRFHKVLASLGRMTISPPTPIPVSATSSTALLPPPLPRSGEHWAIFLDVDGCLLDFADDPQAVLVTPQLRDLLDQLHGALNGALALVSGRGVSDLDHLFSAPGWAMGGLHGFELRDGAGRQRVITVDPAHEKHMRREVRALAARLDHVQLEDKGEAIALHCRRAPWQWPTLQDAAAATIDRLPGYELQPGNLVMEFKPAGMHKGIAVDELMQQMPFAERMPVYLGDDLTDEYGFVAVNRRGGMSVRVGTREPSAARFTLPSPAAVHAWLARVLDTLPNQEVSSHADRTGSAATSRT